MKVIPVRPDNIVKEKYLADSVLIDIRKGEKIDLYKYVAVLSSLNNKKEHLLTDTQIRLSEAKEKGYAKLFAGSCRRMGKDLGNI